MIRFFRWIDGWDPRFEALWVFFFLGLAVTHTVGLW